MSGIVKKKCMNSKGVSIMNNDELIWFILGCSSVAFLFGYCGVGL